MSERITDADLAEWRRVVWAADDIAIDLITAEGALKILQGQQQQRLAEVERVKASLARTYGLLEGDSIHTASPEIKRLAR